ncbi:thioredoxin family protein [Dictyobacter arantiisoli]|uniref:Thioredoxin n=1 Tax=Dictyobacter arantiisoli TaxID=2014874 RepID=A0A5A5TKM6_9CHLR|nr:thioredoxin family protein [Dictyobacter arantiisoli]GCF11832.1 thioredoxin [Dictyobacter arantiisoli]
MSTIHNLPSQSNVMNIGDQNFKDQVLNSTLPVIIKFTAQWCPHCHALAPAYQQLSVEYQDKLRFVQLDVDENPQVPTTYRIQGMPTLLIFKDGKECGRIVGPGPQANSLKQRIDQVLVENGCD